MCCNLWQGDLKSWNTESIGIGTYPNKCIVTRSELIKSLSVHIYLLSCCTMVCHYQVTVAFRCSLSLLDHADQYDEEVPPGVTLIQSAAGQRKLRFQQNLLIHYSNNSLQVRDWSEKSGIKGERRKMNYTVWLFDQVNFLSALCRRCLSALICISLQCACPPTASTLGSATWARHTEKKSSSTAMEPTHTGHHL